MSLNNKITDKNKDDRSQLEKDDMDIRAQLNSSLDLQKIKASEALINRTLDAIRKQEAVDQKPDSLEIIRQKDNGKTLLYKGSKSDKKVIIWSRYARILAGAAAAIFVIVVGINSIGGLNKSEKDMSTSLVNEVAAGDGAGAPSAVTPQAGNNDNAIENETSNTSADKSATTLDKGATSKSDSTSKNQKKSTKTSNGDSGKSTDYSNNNDIEEDNTDRAERVQNADADKDNSQNTTMRFRASMLPDTTGTVDNSNKAVSNEMTGSQEDSQMITAEPTIGITYLSFSNIFMPTPQKADYIKITNMINNDSILLNDQEDVQYFYTVMGQYQFTKGTQAPTSSKYTIEAANLQSPGETYTMSIGDNISVNYTLGDAITNNYYTTDNLTRMNADLGALFLKYSNIN